MNEQKIIALTALTGIVIGLIAAYTVTADERHCNEMEQEIRLGQTFDGTVACYPPGDIDFNISEDLDERTDTECVCRMVRDNEVRIFPIVRT